MMKSLREHRNRKASGSEIHPIAHGLVRQRAVRYMGTLVAITRRTMLYPIAHGLTGGHAIGDPLVARNTIACRRKSDV